MRKNAFAVKSEKNDEKHCRMGNGFFLSLKLRALTSRLRKKASRLEKNTTWSENRIRYLRENFPKTEQYMLDDADRLMHVGKIKVKGMYPLYYTLLKEKIDEKKEVLNEANLKKYISELCTNGNTPNLYETGLFPLYLRCAICMSICRFFLEENESKSDEELRRLFEGLDEATFLDPEECIRLNLTEKILETDEIYRSFSDLTKNGCRKNLKKFAKKAGISEKQCALSLKKSGKGFTCKLCDKPDGGIAYMLLHFFLTGAFTVLLCRISPVFFVSIAPVYRCVKLILDRFFCRFVTNGYNEPSLDITEIPNGGGVLVTVTAMLIDTEETERLLKSLENMFYTCGEKNVYFSLLCDLPDSDEEKTSEDKKITEYALRGILSLRKRHGDVFYLFLRNRAYSSSQERFIPPERKRGAVNTLCRFLCGKSDGFSEYSIKPSGEVCENIGYVFTLDSDTSLPIDSVRKALGIMLHPNNKPVYDERKGRVVKGYGILQPKMTTRLEEKRKSFFTNVMCGGGGVDNYSTAGYDLYTALFGKGVFCGKGMFDKEIFYKALCCDYAFKNETVLSHDAPEGAILRCLATNRIVLSDSFPREQMAYYKRLHRWVRGDVQNIVFFGKTRKNENGENVLNNIDFVSKYFMLENLTEAALGICSLLMLFFSLFVNEKSTVALIVATALAPYVLPFVHRAAACLRGTLIHNAGRLFYSRGVYTEIRTELFSVMLKISSLAHSAFVCADAVIRSLFRLLVSHKKTLEWTTAAQSDKESDDGILGYVKKNIFSAFVGTVFIVFSENSAVRVLGLMFMALPFTSYYSGKKINRKKDVPGKKEKNSLTEELSLMWSYFEENVSEKTNWLPPDNVSFDNDKKTKVSYMTSPTNIGLYLVSAFVAARAGLVSVAQLKEICEKTIAALDKLPKCDGLFYNWYDVRTRLALPPKFVSSVDEGNLIACLYVVTLGASEYEGFEEISKKIKDIIIKSDLKKMYNGKKKLFYIGFTVEEDGSINYGRNCYDMLMSETRILSYLAVAHRTVTSEHYKRLARPLIECGGFLGLASWSGTVFEYFMPSLFMPVPEGSLTYEALGYSLNMNMRFGKIYNEKRFFGISESCCGLKKDDESYVYRAFGVSETAMCVFERENVISPYSSYLMLERAFRPVTENLEHLKDLGMYGKYGFYESCDFERHEGDKSYTVVKCYMSHHLGMSICAIGNFLFDGYVRSLFMKESGNCAAYELLDEKIPTEVYVKKRGRRYYRALTKPIVRPNGTCMDETEKKTAVLPKKGEPKTDISAKKEMLCVLKINDTKSLYTSRFGVGKAKVIDTALRDEKSAFFITEYDAKREPAKIFIVKTDSQDKFSLEVTAGENAKTEIGAGGAIFRFDDRMGFAFGFCVGENGTVYQGIAEEDGKNKKISVCFQGENEGGETRDYVLALGFAKTYDGIYNVRKRVVNSRKKMWEEAVNYYEEMTSYEPLDDPILKDEGQFNFAGIYLGTSETELLKTSMSCYRLMYTKSKLKKHVLLRLAGFLTETGEKDAFSGIVVCESFCAYCEGLDDAEICDFLDNEVTTFRIIIKYLTELCDKNNDEEADMLFVHCLERMWKICEKKGDRGACEALEITKKRFFASNCG